MKSRKAIWIFFTALLMISLACNIGAQAPLPLSPRDAAATIVAQTLSAQGLPTSEGLIANTATAVFASPAAVTPTFATPMLVVNEAANCRSGPGIDYEIITSASAGVKAEIVGKDTADNYWLIKTPNGNGTCWISGQSATASGSYADLPEVTPEAAKADVPSRPGSLFYNFTCTNGGTSVTTNLSWSDTANNENGYRVYRFDTMIADLPANSSAYTDITNITYGSTLTYYIEAYNTAGVSQRRTASFSCQ
ncbi:MAG: SH3 domain-containing protein [Chloroflexi bacterium]|nr:SH3 domain-containing protein [Chloroflexota bacterium]MBI3341242.1 SH3 domain-containing protein [Chloroflexota bacterium]